MGLVTRVTVILEMDPESPQWQLQQAVGDNNTVRSLPDGFLERADRALELNGILSDLDSIPYTTVARFENDEAAHAYFRSASESTHYRSYFEDTNRDNRYNLLVELDSDEFHQQHEQELMDKYGFLNEVMGSGTQKEIAAKRPWWKLW